MFSAAEVGAAHTRLRGQVVHTPLIGGLHLPDFDAHPELRIKPEVLQPSGSIHARGAMHYLMRRLGEPKGLVLSGGERPALAGAWAAAMHRAPSVACLAAAPSAVAQRLFAAFGCELAVASAAEDVAALVGRTCRERGFQALPGPDNGDYALGLASIAVELAEDLPHDCAEVFVATAAVAAAVGHGLTAVGRSALVRVVEVADVDESLRVAVVDGLRLDVGSGSVAALAGAMRSDAPGACAILTD